MRGENAPPPEDWRPDTPRACPFDPCFVCEPHEGSGAYPLPANIELGSE